MKLYIFQRQVRDNYLAEKYLFVKQTVDDEEEGALLGV